MQVFTLPQAVAFALDNNPRLRVAREAIARARGETQIAFAPFLPDLLFAYREVAFSSAVQATCEHIPAVIGFGPGDQTFGQSELRTQWTLWDFGRTAGLYGRAVSREEIAWLQLDRAAQTIAYETADAFLRLLAARAGRVIQEQSLERAQAVDQEPGALVHAGSPLSGARGAGRAGRPGRWGQANDEFGFLAPGVLLAQRSEFGTLYRKTDQTCQNQTGGPLVNDQRTPPHLPLIASSKQ